MGRAVTTGDSLSISTPPLPAAASRPASTSTRRGYSRRVAYCVPLLDSGALITTRFAAEQGRDVFAVPGNVTSRSSLGANRLIQDGAKLVLEASDVLSELNLHMVPQQQEMRELLPENATEAAILAELSAAGEPRHIDALCRATGLGAAVVSGTLVMMELKGLVALVGPMTY